MLQKFEELFREDGHLNDEGVAYFAESLVQSKMQRVTDGIRSHVENCFDCKKRIFSIHDILVEDTTVNHQIQELVKLNLIEKRGIIFNRALVYSMRIAAILIVGLGIYFLIFKYSSNSENFANMDLKINNKTDSAKNPSHVSKVKEGVVIFDTSKKGLKNDVKPSIEEAFDTTLLAENFKNNKSFDELMNSTMRSGIEFKVLSPNNLAQFSPGQSIEISWKTDLDGPFAITFFTNQGKTIYSSKPIITKKYKMNFVLSPGLYYWKLETEDEMLNIGKILIK
jgi:hypothetical protein